MNFKSAFIRLLIVIGVIAAFSIGLSNTNKPKKATTNKHETQDITNASLTTTLKIKGTGLGFLIAGDAGQSINFGDDENLDCSATWQLDQLDPQSENALVKKTKRKKDNTFSIECYFKGQYFVQSSKHDTVAEIIITDNKPEDKIASIVVKFDLFNVSSASPKMLTMNYQLMKVTPELYELIF